MAMGRIGLSGHERELLQPQEPCVHPTHNIKVMDVTGNVIDYTVHMCTIQENNPARTKKAKKGHSLLRRQPWRASAPCAGGRMLSHFLKMRLSVELP